MTWWEDFLAWVAASVTPLPTWLADWWQSRYGGSPLDFAAAVLDLGLDFLGFGIALLPYLGAIFVLYFVTVLGEGAEKGSFRPIGDFFFRIYELVASFVPG